MSATRLQAGLQSRGHWLVPAALALCLMSAACGGTATSAPATTADKTASQAPNVESAQSHTTLVEDFRNTDLGVGWEPVGSMDLQYARCFTIDSFEGGYRLACLADGNRYLMVPEGAEVPSGLAADITVLQQPAGDIYLVASDSLCLFDALNALDRITVSGIARDDWELDSARKAMDEGTIVYGGKYRAPDYELLLSRGVRLAIESTMINHTPQVREKLEELGIPVLVELSSYENEPLARAEWIKLYGALLDQEGQAEEVFDQQVAQVGSLAEVPLGKTVAFFYLNSNGAAVVRRPGDYVTKMIEQAGGTYAFEGLEQAKTGSSSVTLSMEQFYATAKDADVIVYNSSIDGGVESLDDLLQKNTLLADFKAVQAGDVWITDQNMYQQMLEAGTIIADFNRVLTGSHEGLTYLRRLT